MNRVCLVGRLTEKPEIRYTTSNKALTRFRIAVNRIFTNAEGKKEADFISVVCFGKQAENVCNFLDKGSLVSIEGRIQAGSYDGQDGKKKYTFDVVADSIQFLESKNKTQKNTKTTVEESETKDPFADFGEQISIDDNWLD